MKSRKSSELWTAWRQFCLVSWLPFLTTSEPSKRCGMAPSTPTPTTSTPPCTSRRWSRQQRHWSLLASISSPSYIWCCTCPPSARGWAPPSANLETRALNRYCMFVCLFGSKCSFFIFQAYLKLRANPDVFRSYFIRLDGGAYNTVSCLQVHQLYEKHWKRWKTKSTDNPNFAARQLKSLLSYNADQRMRLVVQRVKRKSRRGAREEWGWGCHHRPRTLSERRQA